MTCEHLHILFIQNVRDAIGRGTVVAQTAFLSCFLDPGFVIAIAVEDNALVILNGLADHFMQLGFKIFRTLQTVCVDLQRLCHRCIEHNVGTGNGVGRTQHTELKFIAGERKGRGAVTVSGVLGESGQNINAQLHIDFLSSFVRLITFNGIQNRRQLITEEDGNNGGRCFIRAQPVIVACGCHGNTQQILIVVHCLDDRTQEQQELGIFIRRFTGG